MIKRSRVNPKAPSKHRLIASRKRFKPSSLSKLKKTLEALQKQITIKLYGKDCYTCPQKNLEGANCQLGHCPWPRSILSTKCKFDYRYTRIQCFRCNIHLGGMGARAFQKMEAEGADTDALWQESETTKGKSVPRKWFEEKILEYQTLLTSLT